MLRCSWPPAPPLPPFLLLPLLPLLASGCPGGYGASIGKAVHSLRPAGRDYQEVYTAALHTLARLGLVEQASRDRGLIVGQIPPFRVRALLDPSSSWIRLEGEGYEKGQWQRDSLRRIWQQDVDGRHLEREGAQALEEAVDIWHRAIEGELRARPGG